MQAGTEADPVRECAYWLALALPGPLLGQLSYTSRPTCLGVVPPMVG